jgi:hypothetical protein
LIGNKLKDKYLNPAPLTDRGEEMMLIGEGIQALKFISQYMESLMTLFKFGGQ